MSENRATDEMRERITVLRGKAEMNRKNAAADEEEALSARERAHRLDELADQYEAILDGLPKQHFDVLAEF
jgi:hypothetical protein